MLELLQNAGHADFKDARGPMGFNQRQAAGRFTADEAQALIDQLQQAEYEADQQAQATGSSERKQEQEQEQEQEPEHTEGAPKRNGMTDEERAEMERAVRSASTKSLVLEVRRRGWIVTKPK